MSGSTRLNLRRAAAKAFGEASGSVMSVPLSFGNIGGKSTFSASIWHLTAPA